MTPYGDTSKDASVRVKGGSDDVSGLGGDDSLIDQEGSDRVSGMAGMDVVSSGQGDDSAANCFKGLAGKPGDDVVKTWSRETRVVT